MASKELVPELERDPETLYRGVRDGQLSHAYIDLEDGGLNKNYIP